MKRVKLTNDNARKVIATELERRGTSQRAAARELGINARSVNYYLSGESKSISSDTAFRLLDFLGYELARKEEKKKSEKTAK